ncbi:hypothetical protein C8F04DRAFT_1261573 [Mycena alexandri]|uniref:CCHC-type domain-containing protein n=1 Tax=Mycena alexandri TaxID=1745969 RepID=A0AAD6X5D3_9AGAR|nr:hypothetical protein C8F04DRAFT_1261573 [Mycena alexandri]
MSDTRYSFICLGNTNYANYWDLRMEAVLVRKQLWSVVQVLVIKTKSDGTAKTEAEILAERNGLIAARDATKMAEAHAEPVLCVEPSQLSHMTSRDPMIIWQTLEHVYRSADYRPSPPVPHGEETQLRTGTLTLNRNTATYEAVIINFNATSPADLTIEHVISRLLNEETCQQSNGDTTTTSPADTNHDPNNVTFATCRLVQTCYFCDKPGHLKPDCPERLKWEQSKKMSTTTTAAAAAEYDSDSGYDGVWRMPCPVCGGAHLGAFTCGGVLEYQPKQHPAHCPPPPHCGIQCNSTAAAA